MSTLIEIEAAVEALPRDQKEQLLLFLAAQLRGADPPPPRDLSAEQINAWIADDEAGMRRLRDGKGSGQGG
jgi:hypothetical protein